MADKNNEVVISVDEQSGELTFVDDAIVHEALNEVGTITKNRATHVEPVNRILRLAFYFVRNRVDDNSILASMTRHLPCKWQARLLDTNEIIGTSRDRQALIHQEVDYLNERL